MTIQRTTPAGAARRQNACDRIAEYLTDRGAISERATAWAPELLELVLAQGYALPAVLDDAPPARQRADLGGPGYAAFQAERAALAARSPLRNSPPSGGRVAP